MITFYYSWVISILNGLISCHNFNSSFWKRDSSVMSTQSGQIHGYDCCYRSDQKLLM